MAHMPRNEGETSQPTVLAGWSEKAGIYSSFSFEVAPKQATRSIVVMNMEKKLGSNFSF